MTPAQIHVGVRNGTALIRIAGRATCALGPALRAFILNGERDSVKRFEVDLASCEYMDSTILGVLGLLAVGQRAGRWTVELLNAPPRVLEQMTELGLRPAFAFAARALPSAETLAPLPGTGAFALAGTVRAAHQTLARLDPANAARFADVLGLLDSDPG